MQQTTITVSPVIEIGTHFKYKTNLLTVLQLKVVIQQNLSFYTSFFWCYPHPSSAPLVLRSTDLVRWEKVWRTLRSSAGVV